MKISRRHWFASASLLLSAACRRSKARGYPGYALIATSGAASLAVADLMSFELRAPVPLPAPPTAVLPVAATGGSFVLTPSIGSVHRLSPSLHLVRSRRLASELSEIRLVPDFSRLLAIAPNPGELILAEPNTLEVVRRHRLSAPAISLDVAATYAAVSTGTHARVELFDLGNGQHWQTALPGPIGAVRFRADAQVLLVANLDARSLSVLTVPTLAVVAELPLAMQPQNLCFKPDGGQLFVSGEGMDGVAIVFPYHTLEVEQTVLAGRDPGVMTCSAEPAYLFVGSHSGSDVLVLNVETRKVIGLVDIGTQPTYLTVTPDSQFALVLDERAGDLAVIRIPAIHHTSETFRQKTEASLFTVLPVGEKPVHAAVIPKV